MYFSSPQSTTNTSFFDRNMCIALEYKSQQEGWRSGQDDGLQGQGRAAGSHDRGGDADTRGREQTRCWREGGARWSQRCGGLRHCRRLGSQEWEGGADGLKAQDEARGFVWQGWAGGGGARGEAGVKRHQWCRWVQGCGWSQRREQKQQGGQNIGQNRSSRKLPGTSWGEESLDMGPWVGIG